MMTLDFCAVRVRAHAKKMATRQMMLGRQTACMCVSVNENCSYHIHNLFFLHESSGGIWREVDFVSHLYSGSTYIRENTVRGNF